MHPRVSIVMPTYRRPHFLRDALASALVQTFTDLEVIVCDNGGDEETLAVVREAADPRVIHVRRPRNVGMLANALDGFRRSRGEFVVKLDDDDQLFPTMVEELLTGFDDPQVTVAFAPFQLVDADGEILTERTRLNEEASLRSELAPGRHRPFDHEVAWGTAGLACAMIRRSAVDWDAVPSQIATAYDRHVALQAARHGAAAWFVDHPLAAYRVHPASDTATAITRQSLGSLFAMELALASGAHEDIASILDRTQAGALSAARHLLRAGRGQEARAVAVRALRRRPDPILLRFLLFTALPTPIGRRVSAARLARYERALEGASVQLSRPAPAARRPPVACAQPRPE